MSGANHRVTHAPSFVLHQRPWGDSGRIFELLSREHGRLTVFAQGVRGPRAKLAGVLQPFVPLLVSWAGRGEAPRLTGAEFAPTRMATAPLAPPRLLSAYYLSELVMQLTARHDPQPELFDHYADALAGLRSGESQERELRLFEKRLLDVLGYGIAGLAHENFDDPVVVQQVRPVLRSALTQCLDGRNLKSRTVARSMASHLHGKLQRASR
ncbi:MAG: DNA repair protein RecO [Pseudomonadota bacterium]